MLASDPHWLSERGRVITAYALCGFANFGSIGIQIGGYSGLAPERAPTLRASRSAQCSAVCWRRASWLASPE